MRHSLARPLSPGRILTALLTLALFAAPALAVKRRAFVTSIKGNANLSTWPGASGATALDRGDSICRSLAAAADPAPLPNASTYRAWLSTDTTDAYCHVQGLTGKKATGCGGGTLPGAGPWFLADGATNFSGSLDELVNEGEIYRPIQRDENFDPPPSALFEHLYWTGTDANGVAIPGDNCEGWTTVGTGSSFGQLGDAFSSAGEWSDSAGAACTNLVRLLCLEPGPGETSTLGWSPGALAFLTSAMGAGDLGSWPEAGAATGLAAGDAICANLAAAAHLPAPESFIGWLSRTDADISPVDRLSIAGPWKRVDAFTIAGNVADLVDDTLDTSLHVFETGEYLMDCPNTESCQVWTGTVAAGTPSSLNCEDWTSGLSIDTATIGEPSESVLAGKWTNSSFEHCDNAARLYCLSNVITLFWDGFELTGDTSRWSAVTP